MSQWKAFDSIQIDPYSNLISIPSSPVFRVISAIQSLWNLTASLDTRRTFQRYCCFADRYVTALHIPYFSWQRTIAKILSINRLVEELPSVNCTIDTAWSTNTYIQTRIYFVSQPGHYPSYVPDILRPRLLGEMRMKQLCEELILTAGTRVN